MCAQPLLWIQAFYPPAGIFSSCSDTPGRQETELSLVSRCLIFAFCPFSNKLVGKINSLLQELCRSSEVLLQCCMVGA